jgi:hypothetical protein
MYTHTLPQCAARAYPPVGAGENSFSQWAVHNINAITPPRINTSQDAIGTPRSPRGSHSFSARHLTHEFFGSPQAGQGFSDFPFMSLSRATKDKFRLWLWFGGKWRRTFPAVGAIVRVVSALAPTIRAYHHFRTYSFRPHTNCVFRRIRPPIPTTSGHLFQGIRPPVTSCREAACFGYQS